MLRSNDTCTNHPHMTRLLEEEVYERRRRMNGMSQYVLAERVGVSRNCIYKMESHAYIPSIEIVLSIIAELGFSKDERRVFLDKYLDAFYKDKAFQQVQERELAGAL